MANKTLVNYFIEGKKRDFKVEQLKHELLKQHYSKSEIDEAFIESLQEKPSFLSTNIFKLSLVIVLMLIIVISTYIAMNRFNILKGREIGGTRESYINKILKEQCSGLKEQQYAECSTDTISTIAFNYNNERICEFSKFESICLNKFKSKI